MSRRLKAPQGQEPCVNSSAEFPNHVQNIKLGTQSQYSSSFYLFPTFSSPGPAALPPARRRDLCAHCIWGSGRRSWSHPCILVPSGAAQLCEKDQGQWLPWTDTLAEKELSRSPTTSNWFTLECCWESILKPESLNKWQFLGKKHPYIFASC